MPSLKQLLDAVEAYRAEQPDALITVVVDATFGHRIDSSETAEFEAMVNNNELVCPPAGAIGRGDAFVLSIAHKVGATILSNDSFQEFHGTHTWLFEEGRLIGGKPVPHIGWVFVARSPVRGPTSRKAVSEAKRKGDRSPRSTTVVTGSVEASQPMPVPSAPPPGARLPKPRRGQAAAAVDPQAVAEVAVASGAGPARGRGRRGAGPSNASPAADAPTSTAPAALTASRSAGGGEHTPTPKSTGVNDLLTFLTFVGSHPVGTSVNAIVEHYSSHGAYVAVGEAKGYVPLRLMSNPAPRSAREFMKIGESVTLVVESFAPARRSIDLATPLMATVKEPPAKPVRASKAAAKKAAKSVPQPVASPAESDPVRPEPADAKRGSRRPKTHPTAPVAAAEPVPAEPVTAEPVTPKPRAAKPGSSTRRSDRATVAALGTVVPALAEAAAAATKRVAKRSTPSTAPAPAPAKATPPGIAAQLAKVAKPSKPAKAATSTATAKTVQRGDGHEAAQPVKAAQPRKAAKSAKAAQPVKAAQPRKPAKASSRARSAEPVEVVATAAPAKAASRRRGASGS